MMEPENYGNFHVEITGTKPAGLVITDDLKRAIINRWLETGQMPKGMKITKITAAKA